LLLGEVALADLGPLGDRVLHCEPCVETLNGLRPNDPLLQTLRSGDTGASLPPLVLSLIARLSIRPERAPGGGGVPSAPGPAAAQRVDALLSRWQDLRGQGQSVSAEELCVDHPELLEEVRRRLDALAAMERFLAMGSQPSLATSSCDGGAAAAAFLRPAQAPDELGRLGGYRVLRLLGQGGMGAVFLAEDPHLERQIALKVMGPGLAAQPEARRRFLREAKATAKLRDDHVVAIYQVGEDNGMPFLAMEYLEGESLESRLRPGEPMPLAMLIRVAREITHGLAAAHAKGLVHRDIKPGNLWLEAPHGRIKILDFGLARGNVEDAQLTQSGTILGTPAFMAPEQARGERADARSDLFSLGCVLYRLCTGRLPFEGPTVMSVLTALATKDPTPVRQCNPDLPEALGRLVMRLLAKEAADRPASAQVVLQDLQTIERQQIQESRPLASGSVPSPAASLPPAARATAETLTDCQTQVQPPLRRRWPGGAAALLGVAAVAVAAVVIIRITGRDGQQTEMAESSGSKVPEARKKTVPAPPTIQAVGSRLGKLDPAQIPAAERIATQPKELVAVVGQHTGVEWGRVFGMAWSPDGKKLATGGATGGVNLRDPATLAIRASVRAPAGCGGLVFSPDGKRLAICGYRNVSVWDLSPKPPRLVGERTMSDWTEGLAWSPVGDTLAAWGGYYPIQLWEVQKSGLRERATLKFKEGEAGGRLAFSPDGRTLTAGGSGGTIRLWDVSKVVPPVPVDLTGDKAMVLGLAFTDKGKTLIAGAGGNCRNWDLTGPKPRERALYPGFGNLCAPAPDGKTLIQVDHLNGRVALWDLTDPAPKNPKRTFRSRAGFQFFCFSCALAPDGSRLALGYSDSSISVWDLRGTEPQPIHKATVVQQFLAATSDGATLATLSGEGDVQFWDMTKSSPVVIAKRHGPGGRLPYSDSRPNSHSSISAILPDGSGLALLDGRTIYLWKRAANVLQDWHRLSVSGKAFRGIVISPDGSLLVAASLDDGTVWAWDLRTAEFTPRQIASFPAPVMGQVFVPGSRVLIVARADRGIDGLDLASQKPVPQPLRKPGRSNTYYYEVYASVGTVVAHAADEPWRVFDLTRPEAQEGEAWDGPVLWQPLAFSPDGRTCIGVRRAGVAARLAVWDWPSRRLRNELRFPGVVSVLQLTGKGRHVLTGNANGTVYVLRLARP
jgi:serine/threonine protein kinase/WD40 repeat protein